MTPCVRCKPGVQFAVVAPAGMRILAAIWKTAHDLGHDLTITSGTDGNHSGPNDPHHLGQAYDLRTQDLPDKNKALSTLLDNLMEFLGDEWVAKDAGFVTAYFFAWIEQAGDPNEHIHVQLRKGMVYPPGSTTP